MTDSLIIDAVRSPIGKKNGSLASIRGDELAAQVLNGLVARHDLDPAEIDDVQLGCVTQIGEQGWNLGRMVPLVAGWPESVCGTTVDRQCGSSMQTNFNAATAISSGQLDLVVSAGVEMMSRVPMGSNGGDLSDKLLDRWQIVPQGISAEVLADEWGFSREELDAFSLESHRRAAAATDEGRFDDEIVPIDLTNPHTGVVFGGGRDAAARHLPRSARRAEAGLPPGGQGHCGKLVPNLRRRGRGAGSERERGRPSRATTTCALRLVWARRRRPTSNVARQSAGLREGIGPGGPDLG